MPLPLWTRLLLALAGLEIGAGLAGILAAALTGVGSSGQPFPLWVFALQICVFAAAGTTLLLGTRGDPRVALLGAALMRIATSYCLRPLVFLELWSGGHPAVRLVGHLQLDAFLPVFVWMFAREFPRAIDSPASRWPSGGIRFVRSGHRVVRGQSRVARAGSSRNLLLRRRAEQWKLLSSSPACSTYG